jgi:hypothetical protein
MTRATQQFMWIESDLEHGPQDEEPRFWHGVAGELSIFGASEVFFTMAEGHSLNHEELCIHSKSAWIDARFSQVNGSFHERRAARPRHPRHRRISPRDNRPC